MELNEKRTTGREAGATGTTWALRWGQLLTGLFGLGLAITLMIRSGLGLGPWDTFHMGIHLWTGITVGTASILAGIVVVAVSLVFGVRPGAGTITNMVMIGVFTDLLLPLVPPASHFAAALAYYATAIVLAGICAGMYISVGLGKGPRDGLAIALSHRSGWTISRVRTATELVVLAVGWSMGGPVGLGTVLFSLLVGPSMQWGLGVFDVGSDGHRAALPATRYPLPAEPTTDAR